MGRGIFLWVLSGSWRVCGNVWVGGGAALCMEGTRGGEGEVGDKIGKLRKGRKSGMWGLYG